MILLNFTDRVVLGESFVNMLDKDGNLLGKHTGSSSTDSRVLETGLYIVNMEFVEQNNLAGSNGFIFEVDFICEYH